MDKKILAKAMLGAAVLSALASACSQDGVPAVDTLPEGAYPLQIASVTLAAESDAQPWGTPRTRISESTDGNSSSFEIDDIIGVELGGEERTYVCEGTSWSAVRPLYWKSKELQTVTAWYPTASDVDLSNQSQKLAYVLQGTWTGRYQTLTAEFTLAHRLAKVRVVVKGDRVDEVNDIRISAPTQCTHTRGGNVTATSGTEGYIQMMPRTEADGTTGRKYWEANVVPGVEISKYKLNGTDEVALATPITPVEGAVNTLYLTAGEVTVAGGDEITEPGTYTLPSTMSETVTINCPRGNVRLVMDGVTATMEGKPAILVKSGNAIITVKGENSIEMTEDNNGSITLGGPDANLTLQGEGSGAKLSIKHPNKSAVTLDAVIGGKKSTEAGDITVKDMTLSIDAYSPTGAVIGSGYGVGADASCGDIRIENTALFVTVQASSQGACIGTGRVYNANNTCGDIIIRLPSSCPNKDSFMSNLKVTGTNFSQELIGKGSTGTGGTATRGTIRWYDSSGNLLEEEPADQ